MKTRPSMFTLCCPRDRMEESFMELAFYIASAVAVVSTALMLTRLHIVHALLYLIVSLLGVAVVFYLLGASFVAALEVIVYAGAIMVLFVFVVMMLNLGARGGRNGKTLANPRDLGWSGGFGLHPYYRGPLHGPRQLHRFRPWGRRAEASWNRIVWTLPDWRGTCFHASAGGTGWRVSPELPQSRKTGDST